MLYTQNVYCLCVNYATAMSHDVTCLSLAARTWRFLTPSLDFGWVWALIIRLYDVTPASTSGAFQEIYKLSVLSLKQLHFTTILCWAACALVITVVRIWEIHDYPCTFRMGSGWSTVPEPPLMPVLRCGLLGPSRATRPFRGGGW